MKYAGTIEKRIEGKKLKEAVYVKKCDLDYRGGGAAWLRAR